MKTSELNLSRFKVDGLNLAWIKTRLEEVDGLLDQAGNIVVIASLEKSIKGYKCTMEQHSMNLARFKEKDTVLVAQLPQNVGLIDSFVEGFDVM